VGTGSRRSSRRSRPVIWDDDRDRTRSARFTAIRDYTSLRLPGVDEPLGEASPAGSSSLRGPLRGSPLEPPPLQEPRREQRPPRPGYWELASCTAGPVDVVNWWVTWPAEPSSATSSSERAYYFRFSAQGSVPRDVAFSPTRELYADVESLVMRPDEVDLRATRVASWTYPPKSSRR
jgi:hypothetical protein